MNSCPEITEFVIPRAASFDACLSWGVSAERGTAAVTMGFAPVAASSRAAR